MNAIPKEPGTQFYPTPSALVERMLRKVDFDHAESFLEPEAGKGDIAEGILRRINRERFRLGDTRTTIDCIELDPYLRQILRYNFSGERLSGQRERYHELDRMIYSDRTEEQTAEMHRLSQEIHELDNMEKVHVIYDDFLTFHTHKHYDWIIMNPPFEDGDLHLLHALELQKNGGGIVCLLNAETIRNPYTNTRRTLLQKLENLEAEIEYIPGAFLHAERSTDVEVAMITVSITRPKGRSAIIERLRQERQTPAASAKEPEDLAQADYIDAAVEQFNFEARGTLELIHEYEAMKPYMLTSIGDKESDAILTLSLSRDRHNYAQVVNINEYLRIVRLKYWKALFDNPQFTGMMTSNIREEYAGMVERLKDYDFNRYNIDALHREMMSRLTQGVQETILNLFDKLTAEHSWYPETKQNIHYFNGWKTNQAHKVGKKSIIPTYGMFSSYSWDKSTVGTSVAYQVLSDIEKVFNYLDGGRTEEISLMEALKRAESMGRTRNIECKYFKVDLFKKGTTHIKFTNMELVDRLNIYAAQHKAWLPPNYGRVKYEDMQPEEQAVIESFQGEEAYTGIMEHADYYLADIAGPATMEHLLGSASCEELQ